MVERHLSLH